MPLKTTTAKRKVDLDGAVERFHQVFQGFTRCVPAAHTKKWMEVAYNDMLPEWSVRLTSASSVSVLRASGHWAHQVNVGKV